MQVTPELVAAEYEYLVERGPEVTVLVNETRDLLSEQFDTPVASIEVSQYHDALQAVFADGDLAVNVAALVRLLRSLDVTDDYPGFVVDELLGRELAAMIAGNQPLRLLAEATFHYADVTLSASAADPAGVDDLDAALAAGFQTRLPGWTWQRQPSPFAVDGEDASRG
jgi:hypothetical protein